MLPGAQHSVDTCRGEDRNNPGNPGDAKAEYNILLTALLLLRKKEKVTKSSTCLKIYSDVASAGKKLRRLFKLRKLEAYLVTFVTLPSVSYTRLQCFLSWLLFFMT